MCDNTSASRMMTTPKLAPYRWATVRFSESNRPKHTPSTHFVDLSPSRQAHLLPKCIVARRPCGKAKPERPHSISTKQRLKHTSDTFQILVQELIIKLEEIIRYVGAEIDVHQIWKGRERWALCSCHDCVFVNDRDNRNVTEIIIDGHVSTQVARTNTVTLCSREARRDFWTKVS